LKGERGAREYIALSGIPHTTTMGAALSELKDGEKVSASEANRFGVVAMSNVIHFSREELMAMVKQFAEFAVQSEPRNCMDREQFLAGLEIIGTHETDQEILDKMFTLYDETGDEIVPYKEFVCGASILSRGNLSDKLLFAFQVWDHDGTGTMTKKDMVNTIRGMNSCMDYFGDRTLTNKQISMLVDNIFTNAELEADGSIDYAEYIGAIVQHPVLVHFIVGQ
jgi:Ca2+-binding EF-hand superfamily protein